MKDRPKYLFRSARRGLPPVPANWEGEPYLAVFFVPLEQPIALPHGSTYRLTRPEAVSWLDAGVPQWPTRELMESGAPPIAMPAGENFVSIRIWQESRLQIVDTALFDCVMRVVPLATGAGAAPRRRNRKDLPASHHSALTILECVSPLLPIVEADAIDHAASVLATFHRCLESANELLKHTALATRNSLIAPLTAETVYPLVLWTARPADGTAPYGEVTVLFANQGGRQMRTVQPADSLESAHDAIHAVSRGRAGDVLMSVRSHMLSARRSYLLNGDYQSTCVLAHVAVETLMNWVLQAIYWELGASPTEVAPRFQGSFARRLRREYSGILGGIWDPNQADSLTTAIESLSSIRNRVVHAGHSPSSAEAEEALTLAGGVTLRVQGLLALKAKEYPKTAVIALGREGLIMHGVDEVQAQHIAESVPQALDEIRSLHRFIEAVASERRRQNIQS